MKLQKISDNIVHNTIANFSRKQTDCPSAKHTNRQKELPAIKTEQPPPLMASSTVPAVLPFSLSSEIQTPQNSNNV